MKTLTVDGGTLEMARKNGKKGNSKSMMKGKQRARAGVKAVSTNKPMRLHSIQLARARASMVTSAATMAEEARMVKVMVEVERQTLQSSR